MSDTANEPLEHLPLAAYGKIIRGDDTTSEDQVAEARTPELAQRIVACVNAFSGIPTCQVENLNDRLQMAAAVILGLLFQYGDRATSVPGGVLAFNHGFMSAGEDAAAFLVSMGLAVEKGPLICITKTGLTLMEVAAGFIGCDEVAEH